MNRVGAVSIVLCSLWGAVSTAPTFGQSPPAASEPSTGLSQADLEELLAPIALYADPLLASVLAASVYPDQVSQAWDAVKAGADTARIDSSNWEAPVKSVAKAPAVIKLLGDNMEWTKALGEAYVVQGPDVMAAVQSLRARASANGALQTNPQQVVTTQGDTIIIQPAQPNVIYVPTYSPAVVYAPPSAGAVIATGVISFGVGVAIGAALDCNWGYGHVCWGGGYHGGYHGGFNDVDIDINNNININNNNIGSGNVNIGNNNRPRPGQEGGAWQPDRSKMSPALQQGKTPDLAAFKNSSAGQGAAGRIPGRTPGAQPIASRPAPRPSTSAAGSAGTRPPSSRPSSDAASPAKPVAKPMTRPANAGGDGPDRPANAPKVPTPGSAQGTKRPATGSISPPGVSAPKAAKAPPRPSAYSSGGGGGQKAAMNRGAASRGGGRGGR